MNKIILLSLSISIIVVSIFFTVLMDAYITIYDPNWNGILNIGKESVIEKKIFLIGSSSAYAVNASFVNENLLKNNHNYEFYNLADMSDKPKKRLNSIQNLLNHNPSVILYGVGIYDFEKYKSKTSSLSIDDYILEPNIYFKNTFEDLIQNNLNEQFPLSPKDRILTFLKYVLRGPDHHFHPFIPFSPTPINDFPTIQKLYGEARTINSIDMSDNSDQIHALNTIISKAKSQNTKVILFTNPNSILLNQKIDKNELNNFEIFIQKFAEKNDVPIYFLHDEYSEMNIWRDTLHIAIHPDASIFSHDISKILLKELKNSAI